MIFLATGRSADLFRGTLFFKAKSLYSATVVCFLPIILVSVTNIFFSPYCRLATGIHHFFNSCDQSLLTVLLRLFGMWILLPAPWQTRHNSFFGRPTALRCFILVFWYLLANFAILLEMTELKVDNSPLQKISFKGLYQRKIQELLSYGWITRR